MHARWRILALLVLSIPLAVGCELDEEDATGEGGAGGTVYLRIQDNAGAACDGNEPGADIDAVGLFEDGQLVQYAGWASLAQTNSGCANGHADAQAALGPPDGTGTEGFVSLNGGELVVVFMDDQGQDIELLPGDEIKLFEDGRTISESVTLYVGGNVNGPWTAAGSGDGNGTITLSW